MLKLTQRITTKATRKMPITELIFPLLKRDKQSVAEFEAKRSEIFQHLAGVDGLQAIYMGPILAENGISVNTTERKPVLVLNWSDASSFHSIYPNSPVFQAFGSALKPFVLALATPELYEADTSSISCMTSPVTQIIKVSDAPGTEGAWKQLTARLAQITTKKPSLYHARGIEKDAGNFLGLIGWASSQEHEQAAKDSIVLEHLKELEGNGQMLNYVVQLEPAST
ncbi:hypothetical protein BX600DRAFT_476783 [Xylariales sp. PMI_506]|nr:hypothetical protein BX600DRAFT_476783 [Xylariales sp. PMI_506]